jgi:3-dehydroquinate synthase
MVDITGNTIRLNLERRVVESHDIVIGTNLMPQLAEFLKKANLGSRYAIITDMKTKPMGADAKSYAVSLQEALKDAGLSACVLFFGGGEQCKTVDTANKLWNGLAGKKFGRDSVIVGVGGGVVTDMAGWVAANYAREVPHVLYPTTLLAMVDAAIGGKTGVDLEEGKNMVGRIQQPKAVFCDVAMLRSLPSREYINGLAEVVKYGIIDDEAFFRYLQQNADRIIGRDEPAIEHIVVESCRIKAFVVEQDPNEKGLRRKLNYGHTVGHALEKLAGYSSELPHGYAVAIGMMAAARIAIALDHFSPGELTQQEELLRKFGLPTKIPERFSDNDAIIEATRIDKKATQGNAQYTLPSCIGKMCPFGGEYRTPVAREIVVKALDQTR